MVYVDSLVLPLNEDMPTQMLTNPYGYTKLVIEQMLQQLIKSWSELCIGVLRYFNPIGAHKSGKTGENSQGTPNNLLPYISQVAIGKLEYLPVYGNDYPTEDGTDIRDYIHVVDLAIGHIRALKYLLDNSGLHIWNLGTGQGYLVLQIIKTFERVSGITIPHRITERRTGDIAACFADVAEAKSQLQWEAQYGLEDMIADTWYWQSQHPNGYSGCENGA